MSLRVEEQSSRVGNPELFGVNIPYIIPNRLTQQENAQVYRQFKAMKGEQEEQVAKARYETRAAIL